MRTEMILPPICEPLTASTAAMASSGAVKRTVPKPLQVAAAWLAA